MKDPFKNQSMTTGKIHHTINFISNQKYFCSNREIFIGWEKKFIDLVVKIPHMFFSVLYFHANDLNLADVTNVFTRV